jgi:hypothetical protein
MNLTVNQMTAEHNNGNSTSYSQSIFQQHNTTRDIFVCFLLYIDSDMPLYSFIFNVFCAMSVGLRSLSGGVCNLRSVGWKQPAEL